MLQGVSFLPELSKNEDTELPLGGPSGQRARNSRPPKAAEIFLRGRGTDLIWELGGEFLGVYALMEMF